MGYNMLKECWIETVEYGGGYHNVSDNISYYGSRYGK